MTEPTALRLAEYLENGVDFPPTLLDAAAELRRLHAELAEWRVTVTNAERERDIAEEQRDALWGLLRAELPNAEWQDKIIHPYRGESWQNWKISIWLPVPVSASDRSPEAALNRAVDAAIEAVEE